MSAVILYFPTRRVRAAAVAEAVRLAALRLGFHQHNADFAAIIARRDFLEGRCSAARAIGDMVGALSTAMRMMRAQGGAA
ncbi:MULTISPECIES: hypothetical protein [Stenotrophomonas]|uniref:hypothetical protein n=1 Tax=Stenotrophomonas TaxID=40323 RepID=UPI000B7670D1|nr:MULTISPECIES: hypothetical protein [Stenotrophomonas]SMR69320.1 hypothetical protein SAMN04487863_0291 [Stenotrophomonas sp. yr243]SNT57838.1 hypothetical protein SAMN05518671_3622 [Stenotrophomonas lactitubi]